MRRKVKLLDKSNVYRLQGLSCTNCAAKFEKNIRQTNTVEDVQLNFGASKLTVDAAIHFNIRQNGDSYTILVL